MMKPLVLAAAALLTTSAAFAQPDPLRNVSGTAANPGASPWVTAGAGAWTFFHGLDVHATYVNETGPEHPRNETFSTNWLAAGVHRAFGDRGFILLRARVSAEPYTIENDAGYPQVLQYISPLAGGPLQDRMPPHDLIGEAAVQAGFRPTTSTLLHVYAAAAGDPALGPPPFALRSSGVDFAEAPFAYDIQESFHRATSVVTAGFAARWISIEASAFHDAARSTDYTSFDTGDIDSHSARITLTPSDRWSLQLSRGELGEGLAKRDVTSASLSAGTRAIAATALWTRRERDGADAETAYGIELALRGTRSSVMARAEWVDRPAGFPIITSTTEFDQTAHIAFGYIYDFVSGSRYRAGVGVNIDYHTQTHDFEDLYGHKPQSIYTFVRVRTAM